MMWLSKWVNNFEIVGYIFQNVDLNVDSFFVKKDETDSISYINLDLHKPL